VKGRAPAGRRAGLRFVLWLVVSFLVAATLTVVLITSVSPLISRSVSQFWLLAILGVASVAGVVVDIRAVRMRWLSFGLSRQTPKRLIYLGEHAWITPFVWGFDAGLIWTTYRVSFCSWLLLVMAALGFAPAWAGIVYGLSFAAPFLGGMLLARTRLVLPKAMSSPVPAQLIGIGSMIALAIGASLAMTAYA
jgi:hypothetical protein